MRKLLYPLTLCLLVGSLSAFNADPLVGTWKLNLAKSKYAGTNKPPKELTMVIQEQGDNNVLIMKGVAADGSPISSKLTVLKTGGEENFSEGAPRAGTSVVLAKRKADSRSVDITRLQNGKVIQTVHIVVSADGKTIRQTVKGTDAKGKPFEAMEVADKQ